MYTQSSISGLVNRTRLTNNTTQSFGPMYWDDTEKITIAYQIVTTLILVALISIVYTLLHDIKQAITDQTAQLLLAFTPRISIPEPPAEVVTTRFGASNLIRPVSHRSLYPNTSNASSSSSGNRAQQGSSSDIRPYFPLPIRPNNLYSEPYLST